MTEEQRKAMTGAQRKRLHDDEQRAMGRKPQTFWVTPLEHRFLKDRLREKRKLTGEES